MTTTKRLIALCLAAVLCLGLVACGDKTPTQTDGADGSTGQAGTTYTVEVLTEGGKGMAQIGVYIYTDETLEELVAFVKTDDAGKASFTDAASDTYVAVLADVPEGYKVEQKYAITAETTQIVLTAGLLEEVDLAGVTYKLGSVMHDFSVTAADGTAYKLSELLAKKQAVVLNFWYIECNPCKAEFPFMQEAYTAYADALEIIAMNPVNTDVADIADYQKTQSLTFPMAQCNPAWETALQLTAYPTTVVIDKFGTVALIHKGSIPDAQTFKDVFAFFTAEDYEQTVVEDIADIMTTEPETGTANNPTEVGGVTSFELTVEPGKVHYVDLFKVTDMWMQINNSDIYVEYNGKTYTASNGVVGLMVTTPDTYTAAKLGFGNSGKKTQTFTVSLSNLQGSLNNPYSLELGEFTTTVAAGNEQGVYFTYTAPEDGIFTMQCLHASVSKYEYSLYNLNSYAMRTLSEDAVTDAAGNTTVSVEVHKGQQMQFSIGTMPDGSNGYPAGTFRMKATFTAGELEEEEVEVVEKIAYALTVTDENRKPVQGVSVSFASEENSQVVLTDADGVAGAWLPKGTYSVRATVPAGYKANTNAFTLTETVTSVSMKMDTVIDTTKTYTVTVVDNNRAPMAGVTVSIVGGGFTTTDTAGVATFKLPAGSYTAVVGVPDGYSAETTTYAFAEGATHMTVTLTKGGAVTGTAYSVTVKDQAGYPVTNAIVYFQKNGTTVALKSVDGNGTASVNLPAGDYTAVIELQNAVEVTYDAAAVKLSASKTSTTVTVVAQSDSSDVGSEFFGNFYPVYTGSTKVQLDTAERNYINTSDSISLENSWLFVFEPTQSGEYEITINDSVLTLWNGNSFTGLYAGDTTASGPVKITVKSSQFANDNIPQYFLSVAAKAGVEEAVVTVSRVSDAAGELPETVYSPKKAPSQFTLTGAVPTAAVDLTQNHSVVYNESDGFYHLDSATGPVLYVQLKNNIYVQNVANQINFADMLGVGGATGGSSFKGDVYEGNEIVAVEDYTTAMITFINCADASGVYPLTEDLIYMITNGGAHRGWWDADAITYLFVDTNGDPVPGIIEQNAWMFALRYAG